jgi:putative ABC transport system permease protein
MTLAEQLMRDINYSFRALKKNLTFSVVAILTLALGIGANTAVFSIVYSVLIRPLPYPESSELMWVADNFQKMKISFVPHPSYFGWRERTDTFSGLAAYDAPFDCNLSGTDDAQRISGIAVSASFFSVLGITPELGRSFLESEDVPGGPPVAILSHGLWVEEFGGNRSVIGNAIRINGKDYTVVGILPAAFQFPSPAIKPEVFVPLALPRDLSASAIHRLQVIGRLKVGVSPATARSSISVLEDSQLKLYPKWFSRYSQESAVDVVPLRETMVRDSRPALLVLFIVVGFVLLIACANVANLQLVRAAVRQREVAVRAVLGASKARLLSQLFVESGILALIGGFAGIGLALLTLRGFGSMVPPGTVDLQRAHISAMVLIFALIVTIMTGILTGLVPSLVASSPDLNRSLREGEMRTGGSHRARTFRNVMVVAELTAAVVLLTSAGMLLKSFVRLTEVPLGFSCNVMLVDIILWRPKGACILLAPPIQSLGELNSHAASSHD